MLIYVLENVNISNDSRVHQMKYFSSHYILDGSIQNTIIQNTNMYLIHHYLKKRQMEAILRFGNYFYHNVFSNTLKVVQERPPFI